MFTSTMTMFLLIAICPTHGQVEIEESAITGAVGIYEPTAVSVRESMALESDRQLVYAAEKNEFVNRKCPKCSLILAFKPIKAWHMISPHTKGHIVWED